jgi:septum formation inhibitor-activating ATPase MinD
MTMETKYSIVYTIYDTIQYNAIQLQQVQQVQQVLVTYLCSQQTRQKDHTRRMALRNVLSQIVSSVLLLEGSEASIMGLVLLVCNMG